jgi:hypothetical protein
LIDLLKKDRPWNWTARCKEAFEDWKKANTSEPVLRLPDYAVPFEVHSDASDEAIGGVLVLQ